jgi:hypothetical protein
VVRNLRVNDPEDPEAESDDRLAKFCQLLDQVLMGGNILQFFYLMRELSVDEAMVGFKGRSIMRQHIARKASPTGFKVWMLVDVSTNYVCAFDVYTGTKRQRKDEQMTQKVVMRLLARLEQNRYHLIGMDNFFTRSSVALFEKLLAMGFYAVGPGAAHAERELFPRQLTVSIEGRQRGEWVWRQVADSPLTVVSWMDKKPVTVHLLSTCSDLRRLQTTVRRWTGEEHASVSCSEVLPLYQKAMRCVDVFSQRQAYSKALARQTQPKVVLFARLVHRRHRHPQRSHSVPKQASAEQLQPERFPQGTRAAARGMSHKQEEGISRSEATPHLAACYCSLQLTDSLCMRGLSSQACTWWQ